MALLLAASLLFCARALRGPVRSVIVMRETAQALKPAESAGQEIANSTRRLEWPMAGGRLAGFFERSPAAPSFMASLSSIVRFRRSRLPNVGRTSGET